MRWTLGILGLALVAQIASASVAHARPVSESLRPVARPDARAESPDKSQTVNVGAPPAALGLTRSLRPVARPAIIPVAKTAKRQPKRGSVCRDRSIRGAEIGPVAGKLTGCGVSEAVRVKEVAGVTLSQPSVMDCDTAMALKTWIDKGLKPAVKRRGGGVAKLKVAAHYSCRTRNSRKGAKISEHGKGKAIDISAIILQNGEVLSVLNDWNKRREGKILKKAHRAACGPFGTVLGPDSDRYHRDHFHFDTARYRSGTYCR
ncbi:extensin family protein [Thalassobius sp. MITS945101]|uniref:extensin-like domain-containing protein n=1 Tax=Thalassobius sp. MITS945101 TaxID=3096994 RepID=UPI003999E44D